MPLKISHLRRWFAASLAALGLLVAGAYFYATRRVPDALRQVPEKINLEVQQDAHGFTFSRSAQGRTKFKIQASQAIQFKQGGRVALHNVTITLFGRDSSRFDQIYGTGFDYDPQSGDVVSKSEVQIDLESNPEGLSKPDQAPPLELKNPLHIRTLGLVFNQKSGNAFTRGKAEFSVPQANGSAVGASYAGDTGVLTLQSQVEVRFPNPNSATLTAIQGTISKNPRVIVLEQPHLQNKSQRSEAKEATLYLRPDNTLERVFAQGSVLVKSAGPPPTRVRSEQLELLLADKGNVLRNATFSRDVQMETSGPQPLLGYANKAVLNFAGKNVLTTVHTEGGVRLLQRQKPSTSVRSGPGSAQDMELTAPVVDFVVAEGRRLKQAETSGPPQLTILPAGTNPGQQTLVTARKFTALFDDLGQLASVHGAPEARIVNTNPGQPDRVSTSQTLDASFRPGSGIDVLVQQGNVAYVDGERKAWGEKARYTPADQILALNGSPRVIDGGMTTTAHSMRLNRATGDAFAEGAVKSTYSDLKPQPDGALLASSSPIHVTSRQMTARRTTEVALYTGSARLWQNANIVEAPSIEFDHDHRSVTAEASATQPVSTVLAQTDKDGKSTLVTITSAHLTYVDDEHVAHFRGAVKARGADTTVTSTEMDVFLVPRGLSPPGQGLTTAAKIDHIIARDRVVIIQPARRGTGDQLVYTAADDKYVLTGGPPSIFDAERGTVTGVSLTLFRHDDRVLVEGNAASPTVTHTRVAR
jgi:lipopolysaccharide export system protein LptA